MDANTKYKRWGWGAIAGLIGVILIAGLIVAVTMSSPKPNTELAANNTDASSSVSGQIEAGDNADNGENAGENNGSANSGGQSEEEKKAAEKKAAEEKAAQEKAEAEAKAKEEARKKEAANSTDKTGGSSSDKTADSDAKKMPKTGPADNMMAIVAFAVIAGLVSYNISLKKQA